jgi:hypothetical protein
MTGPDAVEEAKDGIEKSGQKSPGREAVLRTEKSKCREEQGQGRGEVGGLEAHRRIFGGVEAHRKRRGRNAGREEECREEAGTRRGRQRRADWRP